MTVPDWMMVLMCSWLPELYLVPPLSYQCSQISPFNVLNLRKVSELRYAAHEKAWIWLAEGRAIPGQGSVRFWLTAVPAATRARRGIKKLRKTEYVLIDFNIGFSSSNLHHETGD